MMFMLLLAQCPCPTGSLLPLIVMGVAAWGLWQLAQRTAAWLAKRRGPNAYVPRAGMIFAALIAVALILFVGAGRVLRHTTPLELAPTTVPRLIFLGANTCRPCREMEPVREALRTKYGNDLIVEYHDVSQHPDMGHQFGIRAIPTTVFVAPSGLELHRRAGYMSEEDIMNKWSELGFALKKGKTHVEDK